MRDSYDVIVVGGGINGLAPAAYMAKCGLKVAVFEARNEVGTNCDTEEVMRPGVRCNLHASALLPWASPAYEHLELERFGYEPNMGGWGFIYPFKDGTAFLQHNYDTEKTYNAWKLLNKKDAETFRDMCNYFGKNDRLVDFMHEAFYTRPSPEALGKVARIMEECPHVPKGWAEMTGYHVLDLMFDDERIKVGLIATMVELGPDPWLKTIGPLGVITAVFTGPAISMMSTPKGGSHLLPHSLYRSLLHYGGEVFQSCPVDKIIVENGVATGVVLSEHSVYPNKKIMATKAVISDLTVVPTFLWLVGEENLSPEVATAVKNYDYEGQVLFTNYYVLNEPLRFKAFDWTNKHVDPVIEKEIYLFDFGVETVKDSARLQYCYSRGELPDPPIVFGGCFRYTALDPTQAPPGMHTVLLWADVPYNIRRWGDRKLNGPGDWDAVREEYADRVEDLLAEYAPNIKTAKVERYVHTPLDITRRNQSQLMGTWSGGGLNNNQWGMNRPFPGCGAPRTPIENLYTTEVSFGRGTWLMGGYSAATTVAEDLGVRNQPWWGKTRAMEPYMDYCKRNGLNFKLGGF